jgi:hypothetical protein
MAYGADDGHFQEASVTKMRKVMRSRLEGLKFWDVIDN